jgi:uncharacterized protein YoxC
MRFNRTLLGVLATILLAVAFTFLGIVVGRRTQEALKATSSTSLR